MKFFYLFIYLFIIFFIIIIIFFAGIGAFIHQTDSQI